MAPGLLHRLAVAESESLSSGHQQPPSLEETAALNALRATAVADVRRLESQLAGLPQVDVQPQLLVHGQLAARTILIPAGTVLTGVLTNCDNVCVVCGDITVTTDDGPRRITGYAVLPAKAGSKRAGVAHADTWWTTIHHTKLTDPVEIENEMSDEADRLQSRRLLPQSQARVAP